MDGICESWQNGSGGGIEQLKSGDQIQMNWSANGPETC